MKKQSRPIPVTQPFLPPIEEYLSLLKTIWANGILTHNGPLVQEFENRLSSKLGLTGAVAVTNGTVGLQLAIRALELKGEVITTPFSWVATVSAIKWEGCKPVFCDVDPNTFNIDPEKIESLITPNTVAIMPVHVFGNPCNIEKIEEVAGRHGLAVIYDAAHALGSTYKGQSVFAYGDISVTSLHATKVLNTGEGGACFSRQRSVSDRIKRLRFFGHSDLKEIVEDGLNGKMTELHAALGLINLEYIEHVLNDRRTKYFRYKDSISGILDVDFQILNGDGCNYSYFPILFRNSCEREVVELRLSKGNIFARRYFYPSLNTVKAIVDYVPMPISEDIANRILCLPLYPSLTLDDVDRIVSTICD